MFFNSSFFDKIYLESLISQYRVIGEDLQNKLEISLHLGANIRKFIGINQILEKTKQQLNKVTDGASAPGGIGTSVSESNAIVAIVGTDNTILYSTCKKNVGIILPKNLLIDLKKNGGKDYRLNKDHYINLPVKGINKEYVANIILTFREKIIRKNFNVIHKQCLGTIIVIFFCGITILTLLLHFTIPRKLQDIRSSKTRTFLIIFLVIGLAQIIFTYLNMISFRDNYLEISRKKTEIIISNLKDDIESLLSKGVCLDHLSRIEVLMGKILATYSELKDITISNKKGQPLYMATQHALVDFHQEKNGTIKYEPANVPIIDPEYHIRLNLMRKGELKGYLSVSISKDILSERLLNIVMDSLTVIVISILFLVEFLILIFNFIKKQIHITEKKIKIHYGVMRPAAFLFLFGVDISVSFLPLHIEKLYHPIFNLSKQLIMGLPISVEFFFAGISILISGAWFDRRGWHEPFFSGLILAIFGILYSWMAPDALNFIISRGIVGFGYGLVLMASQGFVIFYSDGKSKAQALASLFAGIYAGSICGCATGAMLAERIGYSKVFLAGAMILIFVIIYTLLFMRNAIQKPEFEFAEKTIPAFKTKKIINFLSNRSVLNLIFFSSLPASIAIVGFLNYFSPIYLNRIGMSQSTIGRVLMVYGICLIYIAPFISKYVDASPKKQLYIFLGCVLGSCAFLVFYFLEGLLAAVLAILMLGISSSFVLVTQTTYALKLKVTQELGDGKAIGIFRSTSRVGQVLGPIIFSWLIATNINVGITYFGIAYLLTALLFFLFTQKDQKIAVVEDA
ncbi:MAG: MFS transporter [Desulfobacterales bacterium]|nr:MFS transporter [Desulfobacterales bacterium]